MVIYITVFSQVVIVTETFINVILKKNNFNKYFYMKFATDTMLNYPKCYIYNSCLIVFHSSLVLVSFIHILNSYFADTGAIIWLTQY